MPTTPTKKINMTTYFENLTVKLHFLYVFKTYQISCQLDIIYYLIHKLLFMYNFRQKKLKI